ncbi:glycine betaine ABC transporter substrate-binding protein [Aquibacillus sediminis]|uniref:glycine betaine ABC transporter substrate-binding protein n=1 Tax=Aquibacillus sediminis TaxID=2574734 RepID=UPI001FE6E252|nr:glycine betaine ABC transporter substrate-binding protein [Aquibacillus sediminis]
MIIVKKLGLMASLFIILLLTVGCGQDNRSDASENSTNVSEAVEHTIIGIEPGAGITQATENALSDYENLNNWELETSSAAAILTELGNAIDNQEPIVVTGWSPHYKFAKWDLKYLDDPNGVYGEEEYITTIAREGLKEEKPNAYTILNKIQLELSDMEEALLNAQEMELDEVAQQWVEQHSEVVAKWTEGVEHADGTQLELALTSWDDVRFLTNVARIVLDQQGFDVTLTPVDPAILFEAISAGDADASLAPWMPSTHGAFYEEHEGQFEDLGPNLEGLESD